MIAYVYWNLHKKRWSVRDQSTRRVKGHCDTILLKDCTFRVSAAGRERVRREKRKNVHAGVQGTVIPYLPDDDLPLDAFVVTYNPYKDVGFTVKDYRSSTQIGRNVNINTADYVMLCANKVVIAWKKVEV